MGVRARAPTNGETTNDNHHKWARAHAPPTNGKTTKNRKWACARARAPDKWLKITNGFALRLKMIMGMRCVKTAQTPLRNIGAQLGVWVCARAHQQMAKQRMTTITNGCARARAPNELQNNKIRKWACARAHTTNGKTK